MKKKNFACRQLLPLLLIAFFVTALLASCSKDDNDDDTRPYNISGDANGSQATPPVTVMGAGTFSGTYNPQNREFTFTSNWTNLTGTPITAGLYNGAAGVSGSLIGSLWNLPAAATATGTYTGSVTLSEEEATLLRSGSLYYLYTTTINPTGEIRGQLIATR